MLLLQVGDTFYILSGGRVRVTRGDTVIRELDTGDYFGEQVRGWYIVGGPFVDKLLQALLKTELRTASVVAVSEVVECLALDRE